MPRAETETIKMVPTPLPEHQLPVWRGKVCVFFGHSDLVLWYRVEDKYGNVLTHIRPLAGGYAWDWWPLPLDVQFELNAFCLNIAGWIPAHGIPDTARRAW